MHRGLRCRTYLAHESSQHWPLMCCQFPSLTVREVPGWHTARRVCVATVRSRATEPGTSRAERRTRAQTRPARAASQVLHAHHHGALHTGARPSMAERNVSFACMRRALGKCTRGVPVCHHRHDALHTRQRCPWRDEILQILGPPPRTRFKCTTRAAHCHHPTRRRNMHCSVPAAQLVGCACHSLNSLSG